jgi:polysaccharide export outer membrane protein
MKRLILFVMLASTAIAATGHAAEGGSSVYRLQVGDEIDVLDRKAPATGQEVKPITIPITPDGLLHLPDARLSAVRAEGRTIDDVKKDIYNEFKKIYKRPDIVVVPRKIIGGDKIDVLGPVQRPGRYPYQPGMTVMDALSAASGVRERATPTMAYVVRGSQSEAAAIDLRKLLGGDRSENRKLEPNDVVIVKEQEGQVTVYGYVGKPGVYPYQEGMKVVQSVAQGEGFKSGADLRKVAVLRGGQSIPVNFLQIQEGDQSQNVALQPNDTVFVPRANRSVVVVGGVRAPGSYDFQEGDRILSAIGLAGGFDESADPSGVVRIKRLDKELTVDLSKARREAKSDDNVPLQPNDVVIIPLRGEVTVVGEVRQAGTFVMKPDMRLADAIGLARGWTPQSNRNGIKIFRAAQVLSVDASRIDAGDLSANVRLEAGDTVLVTAVQGVSVFGAVGQPGSVPLPEDARIFNVLAAANGWLMQEATDEATVIRTVTTDKGKKQVPFIVNLKKLKDGDQSQNMMIQPGDVIVVPYKKGPQNNQRTQNILSLLSSASYLRYFLGQ